MGKCKTVNFLKKIKFKTKKIFSRDKKLFLSRDFFFKKFFNQIFLKKISISILIFFLRHFYLKMYLANSGNSKNSGNSDSDNI